MNKKQFIEKLSEELYDHDISARAIDEIIEDYEGIIAEAIEGGDIEEDILTRLGSPHSIAHNLSKVEKGNSGTKGKMIATTPFVATIIFVILGMQLDLWHPGWMIFFIIPIAGVVLGGRLKLKTAIVSLSPFAATLFFLIYGFTTGVWHPTWVVFFIIPALGMMFKEEGVKRYIGVAIHVLVPLTYLYLELAYDFSFSWLIFSILIVSGYYLGTFKIITSTDKRIEKQLTLALLVMTVTYVLLGISFDLWHPTWLMFLFIPVYAMYKVSEKIPLVAYTPFISTIVFIALGELFNAYDWAWLVFLAIPLAGIFTDDKHDHKKHGKHKIHGKYNHHGRHGKHGIEITIGHKDEDTDIFE